MAFLVGGHRYKPTWKNDARAPIHLVRLWEWGANAFKAGRYEEAAAAFGAAARLARRLGRPQLEAQCLNNLGGARLAAFQFRDAIEAYLNARDLAERQRDWVTAATISSNLATLYAQIGDRATGRAESERALELARRASHNDPQLLLRAATLRAQDGELAEALPLFDRAARLAESRNDVATLAQVWRILGHEYFRAGRLPEAEAAALEAYRLHRMQRAPDAYLAYRALALVRREQGDLFAAERLMALALQEARRASLRLPPWALYYERGLLRRAMRRHAEALADLRLAADLARRWRLEVLPAEASAVGMDARLHEVYAALAETAAELAFERRSAALAREALEAAEENRAASLSARLQAGGQVAAVPPAYGELLRELHSLELAGANGRTPVRPDRIIEIRRKLVELELREGLRWMAGPAFAWERGAPLLAHLQGALADHEAYLAFHLGQTASYRWSVTRRALRLDRLPPRARIARAVSAFADPLQAGGSFPLLQGRELYSLLFSGLSAEVLDKRIWFLGLEADLFRVPFAALPESEQAGRPVYLIEHRAIQIVPGANVLGPVRSVSWRGGFVGVADPLYNRADTRWREHDGERVRPARASSATAELPRIPGSASEVRACALAWGDQSLLLAGAQANLEGLRAALANRPAVVHFAVHVVATEPHRERFSLALSLHSEGRPELLDPEAIRSLKPAPRLVVLSGCRSARGAVLPGAGLLGLTRAWLLAGSEAVIASLWPVPDERGELFASFYRRLSALEVHGSRAPALALRLAQLDMLARGDWQSQPDRWAGYVLTGVP
ncbi:MAG: CHAT domain-containing protein [Bryobacterales bacterium]|nr:CHAT domain-containing protein [Bryobacterales bacterium]